MNASNNVQANVPVVKRKVGNLTNSNNYRPIVIGIITSNLPEFNLLLNCSDYLTTCDNQLGFKAKHRIDMLMYTLKISLRKTFYYLLLNCCFSGIHT